MVTKRKPGTYLNWFCYRSAGLGLQILIPNKKKRKNIKVIWNELFPHTMSNTVDKYIIITFSIVTNHYSCHPCMFITENHSSKLLFLLCPLGFCPKIPC